MLQATPSAAPSDRIGDIEVPRRLGSIDAFAQLTEIIVGTLNGDVVQIRIALQVLATHYRCNGDVPDRRRTAAMLVELGTLNL